jgi:acetylornithine deacetylase/succinyl-diaminopimelate desuccinylase-like protein
MAQWKAYLDEHQARFLDELVEYLKIPSVSTDAAFREDVRRAAEWTVNRLQQAGMENVQVLETGGHPAVYGEWLHAEDKPTLLFYGHFDVQPADPYELWNSPPFEPVVQDGKLYARGAADMKANVLLPIIACEALLKTEGTLPVNVKFLIEGEEEIGSPSLSSFIQKHRELLSCDLAVSADGGVGTAEEPVVSLGLRGLCALQVNVKSANTDMHSGMGGIVPNSIHALVRILDSMRDAEGRITVEGFYDDVRELTEADKAEIAAYPIQVDELKERTGIKDFFGEPEFTPKERVAARPTLEVNGIWGGYQGEGIKTVIPCEAHAKITCRLVPDQTPERVRERILAHINRVAPPQVSVSVDILPGEADPYVLSSNHPGVVALRRVLAKVSEREASFIRGGGTVPVTGMLKRELGVETITLGASLADGRAHAPNENLQLDNFTRIQEAYCLFLHEIASVFTLTA